MLWSIALSILAKKMILIIGIAAAVFIAAGALYFRAYPAVPFAVGVLLTSGVNALKIIMLEKAVNKAVDMDDASAGKNYIKGQFFLRYLLMGVVLFFAAVAPDSVVSIWGAAAGIFTFQISAIFVKVLKLDASLEDAVIIRSIVSDERMQGDDAQAERLPSENALAE